MAYNAEIVDAKREASKEQVEAEIAKAKESSTAFEEEIKGKAANDLEKAKENIDVAKSKIAEKKEAVDKDLLEAYIDDITDYAAGCLSLAFWAAEEAKIATLEAIQAKIEFDEKYSE